MLSFFLTPERPKKSFRSSRRFRKAIEFLRTFVRQSSAGIFNRGLLIGVYWRYDNLIENWWKISRLSCDITGISMSAKIEAFGAAREGATDRFFFFFVNSPCSYLLAIKYRYQLSIFSSYLRPKFWNSYRNTADSSIIWTTSFSTRINFD